MEKDYGKLMFDTVKFAQKMEEIIKESGEETLAQKIDTQLKQLHNLVLSTDTQKARIFRTTDIIIYIVSKYVISMALPEVLKNLSKEKDISGETSSVMYKEIATQLLQREDTKALIVTHVNDILGNASKIVEENKADKLDIDKLYTLPTGGMVNTALEIFNISSVELDTFTHLVLLDDKHGYLTEISLDPKNIIKGEDKPNVE